MKKLLPVIIIGVVVVLAAVVIFVMKPFGGSDAPKPVVYTYYSPGDAFVSNVVDSETGEDSGTLLKSNIVLVLADADVKFQEKLSVENVAIRDTIIVILRKLTDKDLSDPNIMDNLRKSIPDALNAQLESQVIVGVKFTDFVTQ